MKQMLVILGNQFICNKRILNIVQKTSVMTEKEIDKYIHTHQFFKDQRAIAIDAKIDVKPGYIFTGADFVDPINLKRIPIEGNIEEEETIETKEEEVNEIFERIISIDSKLEKLINSHSNIGEYIDNVDSIRPFYRPKLFKISGDVPVYNTPSRDAEKIGIFRANTYIIGYGMHNDFSFINAGENRWFEFDINLMTVGEDVYHIDEENGKKVVISYYEKKEYEVSDMSPLSMNIDEFLRKEKLQKLVNSNMTRKEIAVEFGVTTPTICKWIKKYGINREEV